jgi:glutathione S-transferase
MRQRLSIWVPAFAGKSGNRMRATNMKLFATSKLSPYASRPRVAVYAGDLPVEVAPAPGDGGPHHPEYLAINPMGKIPSLQLDDGTVIVESDSIVEYFADAFPDARLRPDGAEAIARGRMLARIAELYVLDAAVGLFGQMDPLTRMWVVARMDRKATEGVFAAVDKRLGHLDHFMGNTPLAAADRLTTGDCALVPALAFVNVFADALDRKGVLAGHRKVAAYWDKVQAEPAAARVIAEMREGLGSRIKP